jgi:hypothetical protein
VYFTLQICLLFSWPGLKGSIRIQIRNDLKSRIRIRTSFWIPNTDERLCCHLQKSLAVVQLCMGQSTAKHVYAREGRKRTKGVLGDTLYKEQRNRRGVQGRSYLYFPYSGCFRLPIGLVCTRSKLAPLLHTDITIFPSHHNCLPGSISWCTQVAT